MFGAPIAVAIVASHEYLEPYPVQKKPSHLVHHNCVRFRFAGSGAIFKWELDVGGRRVGSSYGEACAIDQSALPARVSSLY